MLNGRIHYGATMFSGELYCVAGGFGLSLEKQQRLRRNPRSFPGFAAQMLLTIICTINPQTVVFMGKGITRTVLDEIRENCLREIPERHVPRLIVDNDIAENYQNGVIRLLLDAIQHRRSP